MIIPQWAQNAAYLLAHAVEYGGEAWVNCHTCKTRTPLNLARIIIAKNPLWSPWDRRPKCKVCGQPMLLHGHWSKSGSVVIPFITGGKPVDLIQVRELHAAWRREEQRLKGYDRVCPD